MTSSIEANIVRIKEGNIYPFIIIGLTQLPDGTEYFILTDPNEVKHLLESKHFVNYHFEIGQAINCMVDKINCNGKIYIEPLHPFYRLGRAYEFPLIRIEERKSNKDDRMAIFEDVFCNEIRMSLSHFPESLQIGQNVRLKVSRIKKGLVYLSEPGFEEKYSGMTIGMEYPFLIKNFIDVPGNRSYFVVSSPDGSMYKLRHKFYEMFGLAVGQTVYCRLIKTGKEVYLEPRHPYYQLNVRYDFEIIRIEKVPDYPVGEKRMYILRNDYGKNALIPIDDHKHDQAKIDKINCRVQDIRKGKLMLNCRK